jgi:hypothetical protein
LIDMDGVIYRGNELIAGAARFIEGAARGRSPLSFFDQLQPADAAGCSDQAAAARDPG